MDCEEIWSGSDTPSISDDDREEPETGFVLNCSQDHNKCQFLNAGHLERLLQPSLSLEAPHQEFYVCFFDRRFVAKAVLLCEERKALFKLATCTIFRLMREQLSPDQQIGECTRNEIHLMMKFCEEFVERHKLHTNSEAFETILVDLMSLHKSMGRISQLPSTCWSKRRKMSNLHHLFHLHLEYSLFEIIIAYRILRRYHKSSKILAYFNAISYKLIWDLSAVSNTIYDSHTDSSIWKVKSFACSCVKEVWVVLLHIFDDSAKKVSAQSFWSVVSTMLKSLEVDEEIKKHGPRGFKWNSPVEFKLWLLSNIASLYWINMSGKNTFKEKSFVPGNWLSVQELIQTALSEDNLIEKELISMLQSCIKLTSYWTVKLGVFNIFLDHFNKNWNKQTKTGKQKISDFVRLQTSALASMQSCIASLEEKATGNCFIVFLRFVVATLKKIQDTNAVQSLSQIKGRIYSKFHKRRMEELNADGIDKFNSLFITLVYSLHSEEFVSKMSTLISHIQFNDKSVSIRKKIIQSQFISFLLCLHLELNADVCSPNILEIFQNLIIQLQQKGQEKHVQQENWELLCYYIDCAEVCYDFGKNTSFQAVLLCEGYSLLLKSTSQSQLKKVLSHVDVILSSALVQNKSDEAHKALMKNIYKPLESLVQQHPTDQSMMIMAGFTLYLIECNCPEAEDQALSLIKKFGIGDTPSSLQCIYLNEILSSSSVVQLMEHQNLINEVLKTWINCIIKDLHTSALVIELTKSVVNLPQFRKNDWGKDCSDSGHVEKILVKFISELGEQFASLMSVSVIEASKCKQMINYYFSDVIKLSETVISAESVDHAVNIPFEICGSLVKHCARAIYSKISTCLLPQILDIFVLPFTSTKKPLSTVVTQAMEEHLALFLSGLSTLDFKKDEFVSRKIKEIFSKYYIKSCLRCYSNPDLKNPFLITLKDSCAPHAPKYLREYRHFFLMHLKESYVYLPQDPKKLASILYFLSKLFQMTECENEISNTTNILLSKILSCVLVCDAAGSKGEPPEIRKLAINILKIMLTTPQNENEMIGMILRNFSMNNLPHYQGTVFKSLQTACVFLPTVVVTKLIVDLDEFIEADEKRRGVGYDEKLRDSFEMLKSFTLKRNKIP